MPPRRWRCIARRWRSMTATPNCITGWARRCSVWDARRIGAGLQRAVEEDIAPLRMLGAMQRDVAEVAAAEAVPLVDFPAILRQAYREQYPYAVFGKEYFVDHVHTSMEGYRLLGLALFDELVDEGIAHPDSSWNAARREAVQETVIASLDPRDAGGALLNLGKVLEWAGKFEEAYDSFQRSLEILGPSPMLYDRLASTAYVLKKYTTPCTT